MGRGGVVTAVLGGGARAGEIADAHTIKIRALAKLGELISSLPKAKGGRPLQETGPEPEPVKATPTLSDLGISKNLASIAQQLASQPPEIREAIAQRETTIAQVRREQRSIEVQRVVSLPDAKYRVLYADPPWRR